MNGSVGSRVRSPFYTPRLPGLGGGGGGVFQPRGGTPWKPNRLAEGIGGVGQLYGSYLQGQEVGRKRKMEEQMFPLELELLKARSEQYRRPQRTGKRVIRGEKNWWIIDPYTGEKTDTGVPVNQTPAFGTFGIDEEGRPVFKGFGEDKETSGEVPFGITPLPGAEPTPLPATRPGAIPTPLPETKYITPTQRVPTDIELQGMLPAEAPRKVTPGLEAIAKRKLEPKKGETDVISELMKTRISPRKARPSPEEPTLMDISSAFEGLSAQEKMRVYNEAAKLKPIWNDLTKEEKITVYTLLAQGKTADELIKFYREQTKQ